MFGTGPLMQSAMGVGSVMWWMINWMAIFLCDRMMVLKFTMSMKINYIQLLSSLINDTFPFGGLWRLTCRLQVMTELSSHQ